MTSRDLGDMSRVRAFVVGVLADVSSVYPDEVSDSTRLVVDLGLDSIDLLEITQRVEDELGIKFDDADVLRAAVFDTLESLLSFLDGQRPAKPLGPQERRSRRTRDDVDSRTDAPSP